MISPLDEYWAGYIHADGSISGNKLRFAQKQEAPVLEFMKYSGAKTMSKVDRQSNFGHNTMACTYAPIGIRFSNLGVKDRPVSQLLQSKHFWRGMIDGDGTVDHMQGGYPRIMLCGTEFIIQEFSKWCSYLFGSKGPKPHQQRTGTWYAGLGGAKARELGLFLYDGEYSANKPKLETALSFRDYTRSRLNVKILG